MARPQAIKSIEETARYLAAEHASHDDLLQRVYWTPSEDEVLLIEVTDALTDKQAEFLPFRYAPQPPEVPHVSVVMLLSRAGWAQVEAGQAGLPDHFKHPELIWSAKETH